jgi:SEC-C motif-containing protein
MKTTACTCGTGRPLAACCGPALDGSAPPATAEALMRSRYTAFALGDAGYLLATWHAGTRPATLDLDETPRPQWIGLQIKAHRPAIDDDADRAEVEFVARYRIGGRAHRLHETSRFVREHGRWFYVDGDLHD